MGGQLLLLDLIISIHALCEEGDFTTFRQIVTPCKISIHALCEEGDFCFSQRPVNVEGFLSTPSARRATAQPRATAARGAISIHALCEEGDPLTQN